MLMSFRGALKDLWLTGLWAVWVCLSCDRRYRVVPHCCVVTTWIPRVLSEDMVHTDVVCPLCLQPQELLQTGVRLRFAVTFMSTAAGVTGVVLDPSVGEDLVGTTERAAQTALGWDDVDGAEVTSGAGAEMVRRTLGGQVGTGFAFVL